MGAARNLAQGARRALAVVLVGGLLIALLQSSGIGAPQSKAFTATGRAKLTGNLARVQERALQNALWLALEQAVRLLVRPEDRLAHANALRSVLARPTRLIANYQVLQRGPVRGEFIVTVRASVEMNRLAAQLRALKIPVALDPTGSTSARLPEVPKLSSSPLAAVVQSPPQAQSTRLRIAVLPFLLGFTNPEWNHSWDIGLGVTELVEEALFNTGRYRIVERRQLEQVLREQGLAVSGSIDPATAARAGASSASRDSLLAP